MAITTYLELQTAIANFSSRSDPVARVKEFITLAQGWIHYGLRVGQVVVPPLRVRAMEASSDITISAQTAALPTRFLQARRLYLNTSPIGKLRLYSPVAFWEKFTATGSSQPVGYTTEGDNFVFGPTPSGTYTGKCLFYQALAAMSADGDTNGVLTANPAIYLYGSLYAMTTLIQGHPMAMGWLTAFAGSVVAMNEADQMDRYSGGALTMQTDTGNP